MRLTSVDFHVANRAAQEVNVEHRRRDVLHDGHCADGDIDPERSQSARAAMRDDVGQISRDDRQNPKRAGLEQI